MEIKPLYVDVSNARNEEYKKLLQEIADNGDDPFSREFIEKYHGKPIIKTGTYWYITPSKQPYPNAKYNFLFISNFYAETVKDLDPAAFAELQQLHIEICEEYQIDGGALCMRFGKTSATGATVKRLHAQLIVSDPTQGSVLFPIGKKLK
ncbi:MAG: hypothetical protein V4478_01870 [Patescibacteria group bacterium]